MLPDFQLFQKKHADTHTKNICSLIAIAKQLHVQNNYMFKNQLKISDMFDISSDS